MALLKTEGLGIQFGGLKAVDEFNFEIDKNQLFGLIGPNGAGKTTLMTIMAGLSKADSGKCIFSGNGISYLPDIPGFYDYLSCGEYMDFLLSGVSLPVKRSKTELLRMVGLLENTRIRYLDKLVDG